jgi:hypothetical protein
MVWQIYDYEMYQHTELRTRAKDTLSAKRSASVRYSASRSDTFG